MKRANGEGSFYYDKKRNTWRASISLPDGHRKDFCSKSKTLAIQKRNEFIRNNYKNINLGKETIIECCQKYLELLFKQQKFGENTYRTHLDTLKRINKSNLNNMPISSISVEDIITYISENAKKYSRSIIKKDKAMINWGFIYAKEMGFIEENPVNSLLLKNYLKDTKEDEKVVALTLEEQAKFFIAIKKARYIYQPYSDMWLLAILTGMRVGEICALKIIDINFERKTIFINRSITRDILGNYVTGKKTKTNSGNRIIQFSDIVDSLLKDILKYRQENSEFLFSDGFGHFILPSKVSNELRKFNRQYKISDELSMHIFRHTFATRMIEQDIPAYAVQHLLGHSRIDITLDTYTDFFENQRKKYTEQINDYWSETIANNTIQK